MELLEVHVKVRRALPQQLLLVGLVLLPEEGPWE